ncbi:LysR family transcriptional regulator [Rubrivivax rivuli]|uniref:LysR family transcriptional regulator n=2 Tax=Rubrivivax rivuli TaxID=1862385 RepID=A0A437RB11_9BURK|nr:LysR family transcriptional regulator [Rubrivivax rivuli]
MHVTFRQLRLFLALAETGSVSAAARVMHVTQPTASMQLREVTQAVGLPLYEVVSRRVHLTEAGVELARTARAMLGEWQAYAQRIDAMRGLTRGRLSVSVVSTAESFMPRLLGGFCERHPGIDVALQVLNRDGVVARLRDKLDDLYIMSLPPADLPLEDRVFMDNPLVVVAPLGHALSTRARLRLADLRNEPFVLRERGSGTRIAVEAHFRRQRFTPQVRMELGSNEALRASVAGHLGLSVLSRHALGPRPQDQGVVVLPVQGFPIASKWHLVRPRSRQATPIVRAFEAHLMETGAPTGPEA